MVNNPSGHHKRVREQLPTLLLKSPRFRVILGLFDIRVDIGVPAEKEVIQ
jgi:hypothetical protein